MSDPANTAAPSRTTVNSLCLPGRCNSLSPSEPCESSRLGSGRARHEDAAGSLRTDRAVDHFAGIGWLVLDAFVAALVAVGMIPVIHSNLGNLGLRQRRVHGGGEDACGSHGAAQQRAPGKSHRSVLRFVEHPSLFQPWSPGSTGRAGASRAKCGTLAGRAWLLRDALKRDLFHQTLKGFAAAVPQTSPMGIN